MKQRPWPVTGSTRQELRQALIDRIVQATLECSSGSSKNKSQKESMHREKMIEALFRAAAAEAESR
jgi:hypothetical protein